MLTCMKTVYRNIRPDLIEGVDVHVSMVPEDNEEPEVEPELVIEGFAAESPNTIFVEEGIKT